MSSQQLCGVLHFHSETGTEGGFWAFQDAEYITKEGGLEKWDYEGLHILETGDKLVVFSPEGQERPIWEGMVDLVEYQPFTHVFNGMWIHSDHRYVGRGAWGVMFMRQCPAFLIKAKPEDSKDES